MSTPYAALTPVQAAFYARMVGDALLMDMVTGVHDETPEDAAYPYITFGGFTESADNAHGEFGRRTVVSLDVWSAYGGFGELNAILWRLQELFDEQPLDVVGCRHVSTRFEFAQNMKDSDPKLRHGHIRFRVTTGRE